MPFGVKFIAKQHILPDRTLTHMTDLMTYPHTTSHISHKSQVFFKPSHTMVRSAEERFAMERMATRGFGAKKIAAALGVPEATAKRWLRKLRSNGDVASRNIGRPRGAEAGVCLVSRVICPTSLELLCVPLVSWSVAVKRSAFVPQLSSTPGCLLSHVARSLMSANVCRRLASSAAAAASRA